LKGLDDHKRVAATGRPDPLGQPGVSRLVPVPRAQRLHQGRGLFVGERLEAQSLEARHPHEIAEHRRLGDVLLTRRQHDQDRPRHNPPRQHRGETDAHLVGPVHVLEHEHQRLSLREPLEQLRDRLEQSHRILGARGSLSFGRGQLGEQPSEFGAPGRPWSTTTS
jgi:hypothetical protein